MTYVEWELDLKIRRKEVVKRLSSYRMPPLKIVEYFDFNNMVAHEPNYCPLYRTKTKCHDIPKLNCYNCGCPHFRVINEQEVKSICTINSKFKKDFVYNNEIHCDCSSCTIQHTEKAATIEFNKQNYKIEDSCSLLELIRGFQLADILGKFKIF